MPHKSKVKSPRSPEHRKSLSLKAASGGTVVAIEKYRKPSKVT